MRMKDMVARTGVHERLLRYYEQQGLLAPNRLPSGYREFGEADVELVRRIRCLLAAGLSTAVIAQVLPCLTDDENYAGLAPACPELVGDLRKERARMTEEIQALRSSRAMLDTILSAADAASD
ncbi:MerR family transcriptional regulator [Streptomyces sp. CBMA152]|uniref:MerR family transcriptional regulator n=1 Tax=Streptomyces sp. CBMA152 TaxID=1896312 RepID=UPI001660EDBF|nr:MerR family transcriptional regulator [Streptomyces sp. CBMA152]MBD0741511.1 MerR family transcriptional regulator [Streptomyces sp. CBMA152]